MSKGIESWMWLGPEDAGWLGASTLVRGNYIFADDENLDVGKTFVAQDNKIVAGRGIKANTRISGKQVPGGDFTYQFRSEDSIPVLLAHFQKYIGTQPVAGSAIYTFVPEKGVPNFSGASFGTGSYTSAAGDLFTMGVVKKYFNTSLNNGTNAQWFKSCIVDEIELTAEIETDAKFKVSIKAGTVDHGTALPTSRDPDNSTFGSYSTKAAYQYFSATLLVGGTTQDITKLNFTSKNGLEELITLGRMNPSKYKFGKYMLEGSLDLDMPKDGMRYYGSMIGGSSFGIIATFYNNASDNMVWTLPNCRWENFNAGIKGGNADVAFTLPFKAYESDDGGTAPVSVRVETTTYGSTPLTRV